MNGRMDSWKSQRESESVGENKWKERAVKCEKKNAEGERTILCQPVRSVMSMREQEERKAEEGEESSDA